MGGSATATGAGAIATGGSATTDVRINGSIALGDKVAEEAAKAAQAYLKAPPVGETVDAIKKKAVDKGVDAGVKKAGEEGKKPTDNDVKELRSKLKEGVDRAVAGNKGQ
jgi:hypothetical protein